MRHVTQYAQCNCCCGHCQRQFSVSNEGEGKTLLWNRKLKDENWCLNTNQRVRAAFWVFFHQVFWFFSPQVKPQLIIYNSFPIGILGGKFLERGRIKKPGQELLKSEPSEYFKAQDLFVGAEVCFHGHNFLLVGADEYTFNYMEKHANEVKQLLLFSITFKYCIVCIYFSELFMPSFFT